MLELRFIRENLDLVKDALRKRNSKLEIDGLIELDDKRRKVLLELEDLRAKKNLANDEISKLLKEKQDPKEKIASMKDIAVRIDSLEKELKEYEPQLSRMLLNIPNIPQRWEFPDRLH